MWKYSRLSPLAVGRKNVELVTSVPLGVGRKNVELLTTVPLGVGRKNVELLTALPTGSRQEECGTTHNSPHWE